MMRRERVIKGGGGKYISVLDVHHRGADYFH